MLLLVVSCFFVSQRTSAESPETKTCQRFVPTNAESAKEGVPWSGFFALDTQTGQLCRTADWQLQDKWKALPTCLSLSAK